MVNIQNLIDDAKCFATVRDLRWADGLFCPHCTSDRIIKRSFDETQPDRQRYRCRSCDRGFDDLTGTLFAGHHQPLRVWILCLYFMGLNLSNQQIAQELGLNKDDVQQMTTQLRQGIVDQKESVSLQGEVECDEVYIVAGHKGHPAAVKKKGRPGRRNRLKGCRGRGTLAGEKPPILGMIQRQGEVSIQMLENVQQKTIEPIIKQTIAPARSFIPTSTTSTDGWKHGATPMKWFTMDRVNSHGMTIKMVFVKCMSIRWKVSGPCYVPG